MNYPKLRHVILTSVLLIVIYSCQNETKGTIDYKINGNVISFLNKNDFPILKSTSNYHINGHINLESYAIKKQTPFVSLERKDTSNTYITLNGRDSLMYRTLIITKFDRDTLFLLNKKGNERNYVFIGHFASKILTVQSANDTLNYNISGTFNDTIQIVSSKINYSDLITHHIIDQELIKHLHSEINSNSKHYQSEIIKWSRDISEQ